MEALIVLAHPDPGSLCSSVADDVCGVLTRKGHHVRLLDLYAEDFDPVMSSADRVAYESEDAIVDAVVRRHADFVKRAEALVFVYPTVSGGLPAMMKGWLDRVMVTGVAFRLDPKTNKIKPGLRHVRRIVVATTNPASRAITALRNDTGRRTLTRTLRLVCHRLARRRFDALYRCDTRSEAEQNIFRDRVVTACARWA